MAKRNTRAVTQTQTVETDAIEALITALNTIEGLAFVEDAWVNKAPDNYGVVELTGQSGRMWADGAMTDQAFRLTVTLYVKGGSHKYVDQVQAVFAGLDASYTLMEHEYAADINRVKWAWDVIIYGPIVETVTVVVNGNG